MFQLQNSRTFDLLLTRDVNNRDLHGLWDIPLADKDYATLNSYIVIGNNVMDKGKNQFSNQYMGSKQKLNTDIALFKQPFQQNMIHKLDFPLLFD